jgi:hypothetical protein
MLAKNAYAGTAFKICRAELERQKLKWCILSASYGFIWPTTYIEWYDEKMTPVTEDTDWENCFGFITNRQYARLMTAEHIVVLGSNLYANAAAVLLRRPVESPVAGLPIGKMLASLKLYLTKCGPPVFHHERPATTTQESNSYAEAANWRAGFIRPKENHVHERRQPDRDVAHQPWWQTQDRCQAHDDRRGRARVVSKKWRDARLYAGQS